MGPHPLKNNVGPIPHMYILVAYNVQQRKKRTRAIIVTRNSYDGMTQALVIFAFRLAIF